MIDGLLILCKVLWFFPPKIKKLTGSSSSTVLHWSLQYPQHHKARADCAVQATCVVGIPLTNLCFCLHNLPQCELRRVERWICYSLESKIQWYLMVLYFICWRRCHKTHNDLSMRQGFWCVPFVNVTNHICSKTASDHRKFGFVLGDGDITVVSLYI